MGARIISPKLQQAKLRFISKKCAINKKHSQALEKMSKASQERQLISHRYSTIWLSFNKKKKIFKERKIIL